MPRKRSSAATILSVFRGNSRDREQIKSRLPYCHRVSGKEQDAKRSISQMELVYNHIFNRWEVFSEKSVIRNGEKQPVFVSESADKAFEYIARTDK